MNFALLFLGLFGAGGILGGGARWILTYGLASALDEDNDAPGNTTGDSVTTPVIDDDPVVTPITPVIPVTPAASAAGLTAPEIDFSDYDTIIDGRTFTSGLSLDNGDSNTLIINSTFENINGTAISLRNVENVTIANSEFRNIEDFGILLRSSGGSDGVTIMGNSFEDIGGDGIHAAKRFDDDVDHTNLMVYDNDLHDTGTKGFYYHGIYVQSSEAVVWGNELTGTVGANGISIRGDGIVHDNYVDVTSGREYGAGIKYFSDHQTGPSKKLTISENVVEANNLYAAIQLDVTTSKKPSSMDIDDWVVNDFVITNNDVDARNDYIIDNELERASWATIQLDNTRSANALAYADVLDLPEVPAEVTIDPEDEAVDLVAYG